MEGARVGRACVRARDAPERHVDLGVEEDEHGEGDDPDGQEAEPVEVDGVERVQPQLGRAQRRQIVRWAH